METRGRKERKMNYDVEDKLRKITKAWSSLIIPFQFNRNEVNYEEQELTNYIVGIENYFHDTFEIVLEPCKYDSFAEMFSYYISFLQAIYIQQDLTIELLGLFKIDNSKKTLNHDPNYKENRDIRNELIGHPISRERKKNELISSTMFGYRPERDSITYLRYHKENNFNGETVSYCISEIRKRHILFLNHYFDEITNKIKVVLQIHLLKLNELICELKTSDFKTIITELSKYFESIFDYSYEFNKERVEEIYNKQEEHERYKNFIDYFLFMVNESILDIKMEILDFLEMKEKKRDELVFQYNNTTNNGEFHYELRKLGEYNQELRNFEFNSMIIRKRFPDDVEINTEIDFMFNNFENIIEYYTSLEYLTQIISKKTTLILF